MSTVEFSEKFYLERYPDVAAAIKKGRFRNAREHFDSFGSAEGRFPTAAVEKSKRLDVRVGTNVIVNGAKLLSERLKKPHTYIVVGSSRGGTSSIAFAMYHQGIDMGVEDTVNYEDPIFVENIKPQRFAKDAIVARIEERNADKDVWAMKVPDAAFHIEKLEPLLRNPIFIFVYRNPVSVARSVLLRTKAFDQSPLGLKQALTHSATFYSNMTKTISTIKSPVLLVEYEKILSNTHDTLNEVFGTLEMDLVDRELLLDHISKPGYKNVRTNRST